MTEVIPSSSQQQRQPPGSQQQKQQQPHQQQQTGPLTRSAMSAARLAGGGSTPSTSSSIRTAVGGGESASIPAARATSTRQDTHIVTSAPLLPSGPAHSTRDSSFSSSSHGHIFQLGSGPITRKRAASINTEEANNRSRIESLTLQTPTSNPSSFHGDRVPEDNGSGQDLVCLCVPPPKIPRPRNAFILYRQAHQATIVQQNPGLANPDISKIIGENWKAEPEESKNRWKELAEAEKLRHQTQFPGYRYQPRRGNKSGAPSGRTTAPGQDPHKCPNCGGRYIATPRTPSTPFMTPTAAKQPPFPGGGGHPPPPGYPRHQRPPPTPASVRGAARPQWGPQGSGANLYDIREHYEDAYSPSEAKRRRYNAAGNYQNYHSLPSPPPPLPHSYPGPPRGSVSRASMSMSSSPTPGYGPPQLPGPSSMLARVSPGPSPLSGGSITGSMAPPPVPRAPSLSLSMSSPYGPPSHQYPPPPPQHQTYLHQSQQQRTGSLPSVLSGGASQPPTGGEFDESLRLPPLHLSTSTSNPSTSRIPISPDNESEIGSAYPSSIKTAFSSSHPPSAFSGTQSNPRQDSKEEEAARRSVEAMVMSISYINKLRVLERISPPLGSDPQGTRKKRRGPIIAVEGVDLSLMKLVGGVIERALRQERGENWDIMTWNAADDESSDDGATEERPGSFSSRESNASSSKVVLGSRAGSTTPVPFRQPSDSSPFETYLRTITKWHAKSNEIVSFVTSPQGSSSSASHPSSDTESMTPTPRHRHPLPGHASSPKVPIALLPSGFSLTLSDKFACQTPISDSYAPVDHWQWMATLWRGVAGADLVVYVKGIYQQQQQQSSNLSPKEQQQQGGGVEIKAGGLIAVKIPVLMSQEGGSSSQGEQQQVVVDEKIERRLGFEVVEWVRGGSWLGQGGQQQQGEAMEF
ncbi:slightly ste11-like protein [Podospora pseudocomata]|uniref:Slightly ste11-like protein n=1 Tax=Podospora pseudocomata TaxID=2093779 RepID=A0ABR0G6C5_9PEZI|nr:slightly ste11-like protein [Podospora pseudocomata]